MAPTPLPTVFPSCGRCSTEDTWMVAWPLLSLASGNVSPTKSKRSQVGLALAGADYGHILNSGCCIQQP